MDFKKEYEDHFADLKTLSKDQLDILFSPSAWNKRMSKDEVVGDHVRFVTEASSRVRDVCKCELNIPYGASERQGFDILTGSTTSEGSPMFVYFHGGYWQALSRDCYHYLASPMVDRGATFIAAGYDFAPTVTMTEIVRQAGLAVEKILQLAEERKSSGVYLCGHSAGAQLAVMALAGNRTIFERLKTTSLIEGFVLISGVYDLRPLLSTKENTELRMIQTEAWDSSPINESNVSALKDLCQGASIVLAVGEYDTPEFRKQAEYYDMFLKESGFSTKYLDVSGLDHFNLVEKMEDPNYSITQVQSGICSYSQDAGDLQDDAFVRHQYILWFHGFNTNEQG